MRREGKWSKDEGGLREKKIYLDLEKLRQRRREQSQEEIK